MYNAAPISLIRRSLGSVFAALVLIGGPALADTYNLILKDSAGNPQGCAPGGFEFTKAEPGPFAPTSISVTIPANCILGVTDAVTFKQAGATDPVQVLVATVKNSNEAPKHGDIALSVVGLSGVVSSEDGTLELFFGSPTGETTLPFDFNSARTFQIRPAGGDPVFSGLYYVFNEANSVPEPATLALFAAGLIGLWIHQRQRGGISI